MPATEMQSSAEVKAFEEASVRVSALVASSLDGMFGAWKPYKPIIEARITLSDLQHEGLVGQGLRTPAQDFGLFSDKLPYLYLMMMHVE